MDALTELATLLRPAGGGLYLVSTGLAEQQALQQRLYDAPSAAEVDSRWRAALARIATARAVVLAVPSDVGAGFLRGANVGPQAIRTALLGALPDWPARAAAAGVVDIGDVFVVPQLLHDDMLSERQLEASRRALYPSLPGTTLPVAPLSIAERALELVFQLNPRVKPILLGGDHSCSWPAVAALAKARPPGSERWCIVQPDAHTDLLPERLGVKICFATWSYHANELLGRGGRLVQLGIRATRHPRSHWEDGLGVRQFWAEECIRRPDGVLDDMIAHLKGIGASGIYFSNDVDGTDEAWGDATGTPEAGGLTPDFVVAAIRRLGAEIGLIGGDVMEVAPPIARTPGGTERTLAMAVLYLRETLSAALGETI